MHNYNLIISLPFLDFEVNQALGEKPPLCALFLHKREATGLVPLKV